MLVYEMVAGHPPFYQEDRVTMFRAICNAQFTLPAHFSKVGGWWWDGRGVGWWVGCAKSEEGVRELSRARGGSVQFQSAAL